VFADADFDAAIDGALIGIFAGTGEVCSAGSRLLVERSIHDRFVGELVSRAMAIKVGGPLDEDSEMGPLVSRQQLEKVEDYVRIGKEEGATLATGGHRIDGSGFYYEPTIFVNVDNSMRIAQEEIFGPVLVVIPFDSEEEAIRIANDTIYGLAGAVWTKDVTRAMRVIKAMRAGITWVNTYHPTYSEAPWGGYKQSGIGRELGSYGLDEYTEVKQINIDLTDQPMGVYQRGKQGTGSMGAGMTDESPGTNGAGMSGGNGHGGVVPLSDRRPFRDGDTSKDEAWVEFCANCRP
jgi:betaine-aldehyde dehydrogenase